MLKRHGTWVAILIAATVMLTMWGNRTPLVSQTPSAGKDTGIEYWSARPVKSITGQLGAQGASGWVPGYTDTLKVRGANSDTSAPFQTHLGPYGLRMPSIGWSFQGTGNGADSTSGVLILEATVMGPGDLNKSPRWHQIARLDSIYGATTVTTELFQYVFLGGAATFTSTTSAGLHYIRYAGLPPDTLTAYSHARFRYHGRYGNLEAGSDTLRVVIRPVLEYNVTNTREYNKAR